MLSKQKKLGFPVDYGDSPLGDEDRLSVSVVKGMQSKRSRDIVSGICSFILIAGVHVRPTNAIPPESIEYIAQAAAEVASEMPKGIPPTIGGTAAGRAAGALGPAPIPVIPGIPVAAPTVPNFTYTNGVPGTGGPGTPFGPGGPGGPPSPGQPPILIGIPRPSTTLTRSGNTFLFAGSIGWVCLNAYWGNPVAIAGCTTMIGTWFFTAIGVKLGG